MRILFTGGSSFTGMWFIRALSAAGHSVTAVFRHAREEYGDPLRSKRVALAASCCDAVHVAAFGDGAFLSIVKNGPWDLFAHHAADVTNYRSPDFEVVGALQNNTLNLPAVLDALGLGGCRKVLLTGSVFEGGEGAGSDQLAHFSPYGLSKALTAEAFRFYCRRAGFSLGKFVIPNPFGPFEEPRYVSYLMKSWFAQETASCSSPLYVRDNIHVSLLARAYVRFAEQLPATSGFTRLNPSGYVETQGAFTLRVASELRARLGLACNVELRQQNDFPEPRVRINTDAVDGRALAWSESDAWDEVARYYREQHAKGIR